MFYLVGNKSDLVAERKFDKDEVMKAAAAAGLEYAEGNIFFPLINNGEPWELTIMEHSVSSANGGGMNDLLQSAIRRLLSLPKKPSLEELLNSEGTKA